jgi:chromosome segregation ATPase
LRQIKAAYAIRFQIDGATGAEGEMFARKSSLHGYLELAKKRIDEMDAALAALEKKAKTARSRDRLAKAIADLKKRRNGFAVQVRRMQTHATTAEARMKKLSLAGHISWAAFRVALVRSRKAFARSGRVTAKAMRRAVR